MTTADLIRSYVIERYIDPARTAGHELVRIRLGNIRREMGLTNPLQSVRSALSAQIFQDQAGVELLEFVPKVAIGLEPWYSIKQGTRDGGSHGLDRGQSGEV